jgi:type VI secretion system secreted protein VgrG
MGAYSQAERPMALATPLSNQDALLLAKMTGREALSEPFSFQLELLAEQAVPFEPLLGQPATVRLSGPGGAERFINGILCCFRRGGRVSGPLGRVTFIRYHAELVPRLWLLSKRVQSRIFQRLSVRDILNQVLKNEWRLSVQLQLTGTFLPRNYCTQYRESDLAFVSRLMEEEGLCYYFQYTSTDHVLIVTDSLRNTPSLPEPSTLHYCDPASQDPGGQPGQSPRIRRWQKSQALRACKYTLWDHCFEIPDDHLEAQESIVTQAAVGQKLHRLNHQVRVNGVDLLEIYDYPGGYAKRFDGVGPTRQDEAADLQKVFQDNLRTAKIRMEQEASAGLEIKGSSEYGHLVPGSHFTLDRHFEDNGSYVLTRVKHVADLEADYLSGEDCRRTFYSNRFRAHPIDLPYRPARITPRPVIQGTQTAKVVSTGTEEIYVDKYGRVKVQFYWDRQGKSDTNSSCWIRVGQVWAGKRWGAFFWPRVGHEVIVAFEEGDPDRPIIVGSVYNGINMPPLELPSASTSCGLKSSSVGGDPLQNFNSVVFHDLPPSEHVEIHSETHESITSESSKFQMVSGPSVHLVGTPLPGMGGTGSGSGGGLPDVVEILSYMPFMPDKYKNWMTHNVPGCFNLTSGDEVDTVLGTRFSHIWGPEIYMSIDWQGLICDWVGEHSFDWAKFLANPLFQALWLGAGATGLVCGRNSSLYYGGPNLTVVRGEDLEVSEPAFWGDLTQLEARYQQNNATSAAQKAAALAAKTMSLLLATVSLTGNLLARILCQPDPTKSPDAPSWGVFLFNEVYTRLLGLLVVFKTKYARVMKAYTEAKDLAAVATANAKIQTLRDDLMSVGIWLQNGHWRLRDSIRALKLAVEGLPDPAGQHGALYNGDYLVQASTIGFVASRGDAPNKSIFFVVQGDDDDFPATGFNLTGQGVVNLECGAGIVSIVYKADDNSIVTLDGGKLGQVKLQVGMPKVGPRVTLDGTANSIDLAVGAAGTGASIKLDLNGITLQFGVYKLELTANGIAQTVGTNKVEVTPAQINLTAPAGEIKLTGTNLGLTANLGFTVDAINYTENVTGVKSVTATMDDFK